MTVDVKVPVLAESIPDATLLDWRKQPGDAVEKDEILIELETDKVVLEVPAPEAGVLAEVLKQTGETVLSEEVLARIDNGVGAGAGPVSLAADAGPAPAAADAGSAASSGTGRLSPAVRRLVDEHGLDPSKIPGTGKDGRITKADVLAWIESSAKPVEGVAAPSSAPAESVSAPASAASGAPAVASTRAASVRASVPGSATAAPVAPASAPAPAGPLPGTPGRRAERREPMSRLRRRIAERLVESQHNAAILTTFNEVDMQL